MVVDTSALLAILFSEPEKDRFLSALLGDPIRLMSAGTLLEASIVVAARGGEDNVEDLDRFVREAEIEVVDFDRSQLDLARTAWRRFGKGNHRAGLNFGDCMSYGLAKSRHEPLLFKGDDFGRTDIERASK